VTARHYHAPESNPAILNVKPGSLDLPIGEDPVGHVWVCRAHPWLLPSIAGLVIDGQPEDFEPFFAAWARLNRTPREHGPGPWRRFGETARCNQPLHFPYLQIDGIDCPRIASSGGADC